MQGSVRCPPYIAGDSGKNGRLGDLWGSTAASRIERDQVPGRPIWPAADGELKPQWELSCKLPEEPSTADLYSLCWAC